MPELLIIGTGGLAKEAAQLARRIDPAGTRWSQIFYVTDDEKQLGALLPFGKVRYGDGEVQQRKQPADVVIGVGHPSPRRAIAQRLLGNSALNYPNLIHPALEIDPHHVALGIGNMITQGVVMTCDIRIGDFNLFNWNTSIGHDSRIGSFNVINPGCCVSGAVDVGDACLLGTGCRVLEGLQIASNSTLGAGTVVTRSIVKPGVYVGVPARWLKA